MKNFKVFELKPEKLKAVSGGESEALGKTQTAGSYSQETARDRDSKKETVEEVVSDLV